jgi:hypothetical protein
MVVALPDRGPPNSSALQDNVLTSAARVFYCRTLQTLKEAGIPFLVGGAYALQRYTGIERHTKDFDMFIRRGDYHRLMEVLSADGCHTELTYPHWLGKAHRGEDFIDVIFSSGNAIAEVDDAWFAHAAPGEVLGMPVLLCPAEEMIWSKAFVMERERFDGADIAHLIRAVGDQLDWRRLLNRFGPHWRVLLSHLVMYGFIYPAERNQVPDWVLTDLLGRVEAELRTATSEERLCNGTLISRAQYLIDIEQWGYRDARLAPGGPMSQAEVQHWTAAIER